MSAKSDRARPGSRPPSRTVTIRVDELARVEGEGALKVRVQGDRVTEAELRIFEPPRFFEAFLEGRDYTEPPDVTARICGICPVAYQMSSCHALEAACGVRVSEDPRGAPIRLLRRLLYCGEWIESHALHIHLLHAPDFLGYESAVALSADHPEVVQRGLELKKVGNEVMTLLGGRAVHPVNVRLGGFYRVPARRELETLREPLERGLDDAEATVRWAAGLDFPDLEGSWELVALRHPDEYPMNEGRVVSDRGLDIPVSDFERHFREVHVERSNALQCVRLGTDAPERPYLVGPLARYSLNFDRLSPRAREAARAAGLEPVCRNPFRSLVVRAVEMLYAFEEALRLLDLYEEPEMPALEVPPRAGVGHGATEAPRGLLYHRYRIGPRGEVEEARIVPPTSQNQRGMEADLAAVVAAHLDLPRPELTWRCEQTIRNHDPCISCATHFLRLEVDRQDVERPEEATA